MKPFVQHVAHVAKFTNGTVDPNGNGIARSNTGSDTHAAEYYPNLVVACPTLCAFVDDMANEVLTKVQMVCSSNSNSKKPSFAIGDKPAEEMKSVLGEKPEESNDYAWSGLEDFCAKEVGSDYYKLNLAQFEKKMSLSKS